MHLGKVQRPRLIGEGFFRTIMILSIFQDDSSCWTPGPNTKSEAWSMKQHRSMLFDCGWCGTRILTVPSG